MREMNGNLGQERGRPPECFCVALVPSGKQIPSVNAGCGSLGVMRMCRLRKGGSGGISALSRLRDFWEGNLHLGQPRCCCASVVSQCSFHSSLDSSSPFLALKHLHLTVPQDILLLLHSLVIFRWVFVTPLFLSHPLLDEPYPVIFSCFCQLCASFSCSHPVSFGCFPFPLSLLSFHQSEMPRRAQGTGKKIQVGLERWGMCIYYVNSQPL